MSKNKSVFAIVITQLLLGCAATGAHFEQKAQIKENTAQIVVYRPDTFARGGQNFYVHMDGNEVAALKNAGFVVLEATPGMHTLLIKSTALDLFFEKISTDISLKERERKFFRLNPAFAGIVIVTPYSASIPTRVGFSEVPEEQALTELLPLKQSD